MTPDKLYIPTTTLNFSNIMSSESISPVSFYARRQFGYNRFDKVEPNNLDNRILLYDKYPIYNILDNEFDNYPMVIEVELSSLKEDIIKKHSSGLYYSDETIYLNPFTTKIYFQNEEERRITYSKTEAGISIKMAKIYASKLVLYNDQIDSFNWQKVKIQDAPDIACLISKDKRTNKLKGFLYGYILASNKALSPEVVVLKKTFKELRNVLSAIITSPYGRATSEQSNQLSQLYAYANNLIFKAEGIDKRIQDKIESLNSYFVERNCLSFLKEFNLYETFVKNLYLTPMLKLEPFSLNAIQPEERQYRLDEYLSYFDGKLNSLINKNEIHKTDFPVLQNQYVIEKVYNDFLPSLLNQYLEEAYNGDDFKQSRVDYARTGALIFKESIADKWEGSETQKYINELLIHLNNNGNVPFNLNSSKSFTIKSFAAFCQKGESDINKLEDYLISNEIGDFRIAFSLWGIIFGFAEMPKTLTNELFDSDDLNNVSAVYKYIFKQLHGIELEGTLQRHRIEKPMAVKRPEHSQSTTFSSKINRKTNTLPLQQSHSDAKPIPDELKLIFDSEEFNLMKPEAKKYYKVKVLEYYKGSINNDFIKSIEKLEFSKTRTTWKACIKLVKPAKEKKQNSNKKNSTKDIIGSFSFEPVKQSNEFYEDTSAYDLLLSSLPNDKNLQQNFKEQLKWFQDNYKEEYYDKKNNIQKGIYYDDPTDNNSVIEHFYKFIKSKSISNKNPEWVRKMYNKVDFDSISQKLKELYLNEQ